MDPSSQVFSRTGTGSAVQAPAPVPRPPRHGQNPFLTLAMRSIRSRTAPLIKRSGWYTLPIRYAGRPLDLPFVFVPSRGCAFDYAGACTMCNFGRGPTPDEREILDAVVDYAERFRSSPAIFITTAGSFFDDAELGEELRLEIFRALGRRGYQTVCTESRPEYLTEDRLQRARDALGGDVELEIGIGLESADPWVRRNCINKMLPDGLFESAVRTCHTVGAKVYTHVLLKPAFLSEAEAISDAAATLTWADAAGADRFGLAVMNLKVGTLLHWCASEGVYDLPKYWSAAAVLARVAPEVSGRTGVFGVEHSTTPYERAASNCPQCSARIRELLYEFSYGRQRDVLDAILSDRCPCRAAWEASLAQPGAPVNARIESEYERLARKLFGAEWWRRNGTWVCRDLRDSSALTSTPISVAQA